MSSLRPNQKDLPPLISLHNRAEDNLRYIRSAMERATSFTGVSGQGCILAGASAVLAAWIAANQSTTDMWLLVWMIELALGSVLAFGLTIHKSRLQGVPLWSGAGRRLLYAFLPTMLAGGLLTLTFAVNDRVEWLPGIWLTLYGAAVMTAGVHSVPVLPLMGALFIGLGTATLLTSVDPDVVLALGFGGLHMGFGLFIWRNHGG